MHAPDPSSDDSRLLRSIPPARLALIERIARTRMDPRQGLPAASDAALYREIQQQFLRAYFRGVGEEDLAERTPAALASAARSHLELGWRRAPGQSLVRIFNPDRERDGFESPHTLVQIVTDDRPFLVDSVGIAFARAGLAMHLIVHPVLEVRRDGRGRLVGLGANGGEPHQAESWELYEIDRQTDPAAIERLRHDIESTLTRCRASRSRTGRPCASACAPSSRISSATRLPCPPRSRRGAPAPRVDGGAPFRLPRLPPLPARARRQRGSAARRTRAAASASCAARGAGGKPAATVLTGDLRARARDRELLVLTKANSVSTVHRAEYLDYAGVKTFDARGRVTGEHRFLGLWTSTAYHRSPRDIPVLRRKVDRVIQYFGLDPHGHDGKAVLNVLETYPRDELFQASVEDLIRIARGVVNLYERRTVRLLARRDPYHRFYSCLVYVPRDRYNTEVRQRIEQIVLEGFSGRSVESQVQISGSSHARVHVVVRTEPPGPRKVDIAAIERRIAEAALTWTDRLREVLVAARRRGRRHRARDPLPARLPARLRRGRRTRRRAGRHRRSRASARRRLRRGA